MYLHIIHLHPWAANIIRGTRAEAKDNKNGACRAHAIQGRMTEHVGVMGDEGEKRTLNREMERRHAVYKKSGEGKKGETIFTGTSP